MLDHPLKPADSVSIPGRFWKPTTNRKDDGWIPPIPTSNDPKEQEKINRNHRWDHRDKLLKEFRRAQDVTFRASQHHEDRARLVQHVSDPGAERPGRLPLRL